jgi:DNA-binding response OmpR family regulator
MAGKATVLVADDDSNVTELLSMALTKEGHKPVVAHDGEEALLQAASKKPDLILLDVMMPRLDGWQVLEKLRANPQTRATPVLMLTALTEIKNVDQAMSLGATGYVPKPLDLARTLLKIKRHLPGA